MASYDPEWGEEDEDMPATERELADDAQWKLIQKNTFTRWANEHLKTINKNIANLETDFADGLRLIGLVEVLSSKKFRHVNKRPTFRTQKLENVTMALKFLERDEGIRIVNIDSSDIVDAHLKLILGLIWTLILHYSISMPMWEGDEAEPTKKEQTPKQRLLQWIQSKVPDRPITNFTTDWNDGKAIGALVDAIAPGLCPDWDDWDPNNNKKNAKEAMDAAEQWLDIPQLVKPEEMTNPKMDDLSMMTYLSQFPNAKLKPGAPLRPKTNPARVRAYGPGIEPHGNCVNAPARFTVETFSAGRGEVEVIVLNPKGGTEKCEVKFNNDRNLTYSCVYTPTVEGRYKVIVKFALKEIPKSPFEVEITAPIGDATKCWAAGPGIEKSGNTVNKKTYFEVYTKDAGTGIVDVGIVDPDGAKDTVRPTVIMRTEEVWYVEYTPKKKGLHSVNVNFAGKPITGSPFGVGVSPASGTLDPAKLPKPTTISPIEAALASIPPKKTTPAPKKAAETAMEPALQAKKPAPKKPAFDAKKAWATGRGIQPKGVRVGDDADFKVHLEGAGKAEVKIQILGPDGKEETVKIVQVETTLYECVYKPKKPGNYTVKITYGGQDIQKSPFTVGVGPKKESKIRAYGPGLTGGVAGFPANFTVETNGETGALGFAIEGPSQAKIDCKDNGDGSADITYWPTIPGEYAVHILCNEEDIPKSPYMANIKPKPRDFNPAKVIATGPGLEPTGVTVNKWAEFSVDARLAGQVPGGQVPLAIVCEDCDHKPVDVVIQDNKDGTFWCRYMPTRNVKHVITITWGSVMIPNSPFRVQVQEASNPAKVKVYGPAVEPGVKTFQPTHFIVDCSEAGPGDVGISLTDENGVDVTVKTTDAKNNKFRIDFEPKSVGTYNARVFFAEQEIPSSPYAIKVEPSIDVSKVQVKGLEDKVTVGEEKQFDILTKAAVTAPKGAKGAPKTPVPAQVSIVSPSKKTTPCQVQESPEGFVAKFTPTEKGPHDVNVGFSGQPVPKSPFTVEAVPKKGPVKKAPEGDATKVKAYGPGLEGGTANTPAKFTIDTREAGPGGLGLTIEGPCEAKIECFDKGDGTCDVCYYPTEAGDYNINILFAEKPIPGSPFKASIEPSKILDLSGVKVYGPGVEPKGVFLDSTTDFTVDARSVTPTGEGKVKVFLTAPSGNRMEGLVNNNNDGTYNTLYTPQEKGPHKIDVTYEGLNIPNTPINVDVVPGCDPSRVRAYGPGLEGGMTNHPGVFTVETKGAGQGGLGLAIEGPSEAKMTCKDNRDGSCTVEYQPVTPGDYEIGVKFADKHIPGSPFKVPVIAEVNPNKVKCYGPGLDSHGVRAGPATNFSVDTTEAGQANLEVTTTNDAGTKKPAQVKPRGDTGIYDVSYIPEEVGKMDIDVTYGGLPVANSPFHIKVLPTFDASKVRVSGDGIQPSGVKASIPVSFLIDTREAGYADLDVGIIGPDGKPVKPIISDNGDGTVTVQYMPESVGRYTIDIKFGQQPIREAPFYVKAEPVGDASKVKVPDNLATTVPVGEECVITVNASEAGPGNLTCRISTAGDSDVDIDIVDNGDGTISIVYTPRAPGAYQINIKFGGQPVPNGTFTQKAGAPGAPVEEDLIGQERAPGFQAAPESGLYPVDFCIPVGPIFSFVKAEITTPSGKKDHPKIVDNRDGTVRVKYQPTEAGLHELAVSYNEQPIKGSPFKFHVEKASPGKVIAYGPGLSTGVSGKPATFTIITKDAGAGGLSLAVEGPSKAEIQCKDNKDGTCSVSYLPVAPGEYNIIIKFADKHIPGSPFTAKVTGEDEEKLKAQMSVGTSSEVSLKTLKVTEQEIATLTATIRTPSGTEEPCILKRLANGHLGISFTPHETGEHLVNVFKNGKPIPNSPFKIKVGESEIGNCSKVKVTGKGVTQGMANETNEFIVDTKESGYGGLSLSIEGPSKADIECMDNEDGTCCVAYKPTEPGDYIVNVKFADEHVPGSPFLVKVGGEPSGKMTERISRLREAADITHIGSQCELSLKIPGTNARDMEASVSSPSGVTEKCELVEIDKCHYSIKFVPQEMGVHTVSVKHKGMHIPGSPFQFTVGPITEGGAHKVRASGPGLERGIVKQPCEFNIYTREAGAGGLSIACEGPSKAEIDFQDRKDGTCGVTYKCDEPGEYLVSVKFNDQHIPDSPFKVQVAPAAGETRKLTVENLEEQSLSINQPAAFTVDFHGAEGQLDARVVSPSGAEEEAIIQEVDKDDEQKASKYGVRFIPRENGVHFVHVRLNGNHVPGSPFRVMVGRIDADVGMVRAYGDGLSRGNTGQPCKFIVDTRKAGSGALAVTVDGPSKVQLTCTEVEEGYEFTYTPSAPGDYLITIKYAGNVHIPGSPFKAKIEGPGRIMGDWSEQSQVVVETVTKTSTTQQYAGMPEVQYNAKQVTAKGLGLQKAFTNKETSFTVDCSKAGNNMLMIGIMGPEHPCEELHVKHQGRNVYHVTYRLGYKGKYIMVMKWGEEQIPGSPFHIVVK